MFFFDKIILNDIFLKNITDTVEFLSGSRKTRDTHVISDQGT